MNIQFDLNELKNFLIYFYNLTEFKTAVFDSSFNEILAYPRRLSHFCNCLRSNAKLNELCRNCDFEFFKQCEKSKEAIIYECHAGLAEILIPIIIEGEIVAYFMCGQISHTESKYSSWENLQHYLKNFELDFESLKQIFEKKPVYSKTKILGAANVLPYVLHNFDRFIYKNKETNSFAQKLDEYILNHLKDNMNVDKLCSEFGYKKTRFYELTNSLYGIGIKKHIRQLRVQKAKKLLSTTDLSIAEISAKVGIDDYNYFTKIFKEESSSTPSEFRKNNFSKLLNE